MRITTRTVCLILVAGLAMGTAHAAREYRPADPAGTGGLSPPEGMLVHAMLRDMGLELPPERRVDPPSPSPAPGPGPAPAPQPEPQPEPEEDGFFDDDFFDDDRGFDEIVADMDADFDETVAAWDEAYERTVARWDRAREGYLSREDAFRAGTVPLQGAAGTFRSGGVRVDLDRMAPGAFHVIPEALTLGARDQAGRGTCTAFAGVRALEVVLAQSGIRADLSEEHFYHLSKPRCWSTPCGVEREGGSVDGGLRITREARVEGVQPEAACPYQPVRDASNITNSPLSRCRGGGIARAGVLETLRTHGDVLQALRNNRPVVVGFTLTRSYYRNKGVVRLHDPVNETEASGRDAAGHANLLVGYIRLPPSMGREGRYCAITANSWTEGWGRGGHACLTEAWLKEHLSSAVAVGSVTLTDDGLRQYGP